MSNILLGTIAIGLAVDDTIHFFHVYQRNRTATGSESEAIRETFLITGKAMVFTTLLLVIGFWLYLFSSMNNLAHCGMLTGLTMIVALVADILIAPALLVWLAERKGIPAQQEGAILDEPAGL